MAINDNTSYELFGYQVKDLATKIKSKAEAASLAPVATSGLYSDLTGKPTIPTVYNGTLTIQQNGTTVDTFTANSSADKTVNIETITAETVAPAEEVGAITASMIDWSTMPGYMHLVAIGRNSAVSGIPTQTFVGVGCSKASGRSVIIDPTYASFATSTEDIILEPGQYFITASIRFGDVSSQNNNVFCGIKVQDSGVTYDDDDIRTGNWGFTNQRITVEASRYFDFSSGAKIRFQFWSQQTTTMSSALMYIFRVGD